MTGPALALLEILEPGLLATVQDSGRPGLGHLGVPRGGAADRDSMVIANSLVGNDGVAAVLELTLPGARLRALRDVVIGLAGADLGAVIEPGGRRIAPGSAALLARDDVLTMSGPRVIGPPTPRGIRAYLALPGGIDVPVVLGSRSTCLVASFGGHEGRPLQPGDRIAARGSPTAPEPRTVALTPPSGATRVLAGPDASPSALDALMAATWAVGNDSDRRGVRLIGPSIGGADAVSTARLTAGVLPGAVQLPPDGRPIILLPDAQPTGGYPVVALVIAADHARLGQLGPGELLGFEVVTREAALAAERHRRQHLETTLAEIRHAGSWDGLADWAGG